MVTLHILIADDHILFRKGVIAVLKHLRPHWLFSEANNGLEAVQLVTEKRSIDIVLLDIAMPIMGGLEACQKIKVNRPELPVIMLSQFEEDSLILHFLQMGVNGYILKDCNPDKVVEAIEMVKHTGKFINEQIMKALEASVGVKPESKVRFDFSVRDQQIIHFLCCGMSTKEMAAQMHLTETSIESYRKDLLHKTRSHNVAELISFAYRTGVVSLHPEKKYRELS